MGACAGMLIGASIGGSLGENSAHPYLCLGVGVAVGFLVGFFGMLLLFRALNRRDKKE